MLMDNYTIKDLPLLNKPKETTFTKLPKPDSVIKDEGKYRFDELEKYKELSSGGLAFAEMLRGKVSEAKVAADIAQKLHSENVTANMLGEIPDSKLEESRKQVEYLQKIYDEKNYACEEAIAEYHFKIDRKAIVAKFKNEAIPYFQSLLTEKEIEMCRTRDAYLEAIKDFFLESEKVEQTYNDVNELRKDANYGRTGSNLISPLSDVAYANRGLINRVKSNVFPFQLTSDEITLIERGSRKLV